MARVPTLENDFVRLRPLTIDDSEALFVIIDGDLWSGMATPVPTNVELMSTHVRSLLDDAGRLPFAVVDKTNGASRSVVGLTCLYDLVPSQQRVELGSTFYDRSVWGGVVNPSCKLLLFEYAFEALQLYRVALRCDARNQRSIDAIKRLGAVFEGTLRAHRIASDGTRGDTMYFSVLANEWPTVRSQLEHRLSRR